MKKLNIKSRIQQFVAVNFVIASLLSVTALTGVIATSQVVSAAEPRATANCEQTPQLSLQDGTKCADPGTTAENLTGPGGVFQTVANILLFLVGAVAVIMLIIGGLRYVTSNGQSDAVSGAKNTIMYAIIGIVVAFLAYAGVNFVTTQLSAGSV